MFDSVPTITQLNNNLSCILSKDKHADYVALAARLKVHDLFMRTTSSFEQSLMELKILGKVPSNVERMYMKNKSGVDGLIGEYSHDNYNLSHDFLKYFFRRCLAKNEDDVIVDGPAFFFYENGSPSTRSNG